MQNDISAIKDELDTLTKVIVGTVPVEQIYLFGSFAYGTPRPDSDFDLYVVLKDDAPIRISDALDIIHIALFGVQKRPMDVLAMKTSRFNEKKIRLGIEKTVANEGVIIYG